MKSPIVGRTFTVTEVSAKIANTENDSVRTEETRLYRCYKDSASALKAVETALKEDGRLDSGDVVIQVEIKGYQTEKREMSEIEFIKHSETVSVKEA